MIVRSENGYECLMFGFSYWDMVYSELKTQSKDINSLT